MPLGDRGHHRKRGNQGGSLPRGSSLHFHPSAWSIATKSAEDRDRGCREPRPRMSRQQLLHADLLGFETRWPLPFLQPLRLYGRTRRRPTLRLVSAPVQVPSPRSDSLRPRRQVGSKSGCRSAPKKTSITVVKTYRVLLRDGRQPTYRSLIAVECNKKPRLAGLSLVERMMGLEPTTFCMARSEREPTEVDWRCQSARLSQVTDSRTCQQMPPADEQG